MFAQENGTTARTGLVKLLKMQNRLHHCVDLVETIKIHMYNVRFGLRMREIWLREVLHPAYRSDLSTGAVRPVRTVQTELGVVF